MLEGARAQLFGKINGEKLRTRIDSLVEGHRTSTPHNLDTLILQRIQEQYLTMLF